MKISYIGSGYVGQVNAVGAAYYGHDVILVDIDEYKVNEINKGKPTIYEKGLDEMLYDFVINKKKLKATLDVKKAVLETSISLICVGTPDRGGMIDLSYIQSIAKNIGETLKIKEEYHTIVVKSTVVPGTTLDTVNRIIEEYSGKKAGIDYGICMNPEFLREGVALDDSINPDIIVIGTLDNKTKNIMKEMYSWASDNQITFISINAAEAIKYAINSFLAMKITFANEWANYCDQVGIDAKEVLDVIGVDKRISPLFLRNGPGYGGSCFPKDLNGIIHSGIVNHSPFQILQEVVKINHNQYLHLIDLAKSIIGPISRKHVAILGLSFKPDTDDTRESPALKIIAYLVSQGCQINAYCPKGMEMAKKMLKDMKINEVKYFQSAEKCIEGVDLILVPTDWDEFKKTIVINNIPTFIAHRSFINPDNYPHIYSLGHPKR